MKSIMKILRNINKFYEIHLGWYFTNARRQEEYKNYLIDKYNLK
jgi:hypothetical protein